MSVRRYVTVSSKNCTIDLSLYMIILLTVWLRKRSNSITITRKSVRPVFTYFLSKYHIYIQYEASQRTLISLSWSLEIGLYGDVVGIPNFVQASKSCSRFINSSFNISRCASSFINFTSNLHPQEFVHQ